PDPKDLYEDMHTYLREAGVDGVKVDAQAGIALVSGAKGGGPALAALWHARLEASVKQHFPGNHVINCMCHSTENIYRFESSAVARASDDFYPRDLASSSPHISSCAYNSLFMGALVQPDWDMFHSRHPAAELHGIARAVSGGPVYVSDKPGQHDAALLKRLVLPCGGLLRALLPGRPTRDCIFTDPLRDSTSLLKVWNVNRCNGVVAVFHLQGSSWDRDQRKFVQHDVDPDQLSTEVSPCDVESLWAEDPEQEFALFRHTTKQLEVCGWRESVPITLEQGKAEVVTVVPTQGIRSEHGGRCAWAPIGLEEMYNGGGAVLESSAKIIPRGDGEGTRRLFEVCLRGAGRFIALCGEEPRACQVSGNDVPFTYDQKESKLSIEVLPLDADSEQLSEVTVEV
ncbi:hypothetical protein CYMTET_33404, partial [Cymbomonas tetramitiformis]